MGPDDASDVLAAPSRRAFIAGAIALATAALAEAGPLAGRAAALPAGDLFPLGVASGDPTDDGVVLWTRLLAPGGDPLPVTDVPVDWEVATDAGFASVVASGTAPAVAALAHSVHVEVDGLASDAWFFYRFHADGRTSPVGRTRTFPGSGVMPSQVRFALASCQNFNVGYYTAHAAIAAVADLDLVVFVGDYVYEGGGNSGVRPFVLPTATDVPTYRARYEHYKRDLDLQASHHRAPWVITMDDHEVANNVVGDLGPDGSQAGNPAGIAAYRQRRADAFQVWYEHLPVRLPPPGGADYQLHRVVEHSDLLRFFVLDGRQYRSAYATGDTTSLAVDLPARHADSQTMLGLDQEAWLDGELAATDARWNVLAQQTVMTAMPVPVGPSIVFNYDQWDGYTAARRRLVQALVDHEVLNPMVVTGDIHLAGMSALRLDFDDPASPDVGHEVVGTSISSTVNPAYLPLLQGALDAAPWIRYGKATARGYALITVTPTQWTTEFVNVDALVPQSAPVVDFTDVVEARVPVEPNEPTEPSEPNEPAVPTTPADPASPVPAEPTFTG